MRIRIGLAATLGCLFAVGACGGSSDDDGGGGIALEDLPDRIATSACAAIEKCYGSIAETFMGGEDCFERTRKAFTDALSTIEAAEESGKAKYDSAKASACLKSVEESGCNIDTAFDSADCRATLDGTVEIGGECAGDIECAGNAYCQSGASCPGTCTAPGGVGTTCDRDDQCEDGLQCDEDLQKCYQPAADGASCSDSSGPKCAAGLFCLGQDQATGKSGTCKSIDSTFTSASGSTCDPIKGPLCTADSKCVIESFGATGIVAKCGSSVASGAACKLAFPDQCPTGEYCKVVPDTIDGTCTPLPKAGEPCAGMGDDQYCAPYLRCDGGTCKALQNLGGACAENGVCYSEHCKGGTCVSPGGCS